MPRLDPLLGSLLLLLAGVAVWTCAPLASGSIAPVGSSMPIDLQVPVTQSVTPGWKSGDTSVRMPDITTPGDARDATSSGWKLSTNHSSGYEVRVRSTSDPALKGRNAVDGKGSPDFFADFKTQSCPCPWDVTGSPRGVFGISASVSASAGAAAPLDASRWGTPSSHKWRGLGKESYRVFSTSGGSGEYNMSLLFRTEIPDGAVQREGSYRASMVISMHPLL